MDCYHTYLLTLGHQVVDGFADGFCNRAHSDDDVFGIFCTIVVEQTIVAAGNLVDFLHVVFYNLGNSVVELVAGFTVLEEVVGVLGHTTHNGVVGAQCTFTEFFKSFLIDKGSEVFVLNLFNLLDFVRGTETVEEVHEGHAALQSSQVSYTGQVHNFLYGAFAQHGETCLAGRHDVLMVTEDTQCMRSQCTSRYMEDARQQFAGNLVHVGNHQQQTLRSGISSCQCTSLKRTVYGTGGTAFRLHFLNQDSFAEDVLTTCGSPFVYVLSHGGRRGDRIDSGYFRKHVRNVSGSFVTITSDEFFLFSHTITKN